MRIMIVVAVILTLGSFSLVAAAPGGPCTETGTDIRNEMAGTSGRDVLCALGGDDYVAGLGGADVLRGEGGSDTMVGGAGVDRLYGTAGRDHLFAVDGQPGDFVSGGGGLDHCFVDAGDRTKGCHTIVGVTLRTLKALGRAFSGAVVLADVLLSVTPTIPPPVTITVTVPPNCGGHPAPPPIC